MRAEFSRVDTSNNDLHVLSGIANDLKLKRQKSPAVNEQLAKIVQTLMWEKLDDDVFDQKCHLITPENYDSLATTKVNHLIWEKLKPETRLGDSKAHRVQGHIVKGVTPIVKIIQAVINAREKVPWETLNVEGLLIAGTDAIALFGPANFELNMRRQDNIKPELNDDYKHLCSPTVPFTDSLFGSDGKLSKQLKDLTEATKVSKRIARLGYKFEVNRQRNYKPGGKRAYGFRHKNGPQSSHQTSEHLNCKQPSLAYSRKGKTSRA